MGVRGWATLMADEGFVPGSPPYCCRGSLWRDASLATSGGATLEQIPADSTLHIDGNGLTFFFHQVAYARHLANVLNHQRQSVATCAVPSDLAPEQIQQLLPPFMPLRYLHEVTVEYIETLRSKDMNLKIYWDGPERREFKQETSAKRVVEWDSRWSNYQQYCLYGVLPPATTVCRWEYSFPQSRMFARQIRHSLLNLNVDQIDCEEEDPCMARIVSGDSKSYILANDSDFCFFKGVQYIPYMTLDASTSRVTACVLRRSDLAERIGLSDAHMVELAILCGNDYLVDPSKAKLDFYAERMQDRIDYLALKEAVYKVTSSKEDIENVMSFVRASYNLEDLDRFFQNGNAKNGDFDVDEVSNDDTEVDEDSEDDMDVGDNAHPKIPEDMDLSQLKLRPLEDQTIKNAAIRVLQQYVDQKKGLEETAVISQIHIDALRKFIGTEKPSAHGGRPQWDNVVAVYIIEKCFSICLLRNKTSPIACLGSPKDLFDAYKFLAFLEEFHDASAHLIPTDVSKANEGYELDEPERDVLPIDEHEEKILKAINKNRITIIHGETGCGKSTRIPKFLLDAPPPHGSMKESKLFISQPRRIAAKALVERLRSTEPELRDFIALRMGHGHREYETQETRAWFVTTGYLVRLMANHPTRFNSISHVIVDECHERSVDTDILCLLCKRLLHTNKHIKLVLMSATLAASLYQEYFGVPEPPIKVGARRFGVEEVFLEDLDRRFSLPTKVKQAIQVIKKSCDMTKCKGTPTPKYMETLYTVAVHLAMVVGRPGSSVLIFVPGIMDIVSIIESIEKLCIPSIRFTTYPIHSDIPFEDQMSVFNPAEPDECKIIIATNAAESSVTLPNVDNVICLGLSKQIIYNEASHRQMLVSTWISKASATQRAGRTGRLRPGTV
jgi:superfamily II DNA/RNA helicase